MPENKTPDAYDGPSDIARIDLGAELDVRYWTRRLRVTEEKLRRAVAAVGTRVPAIRRFLVR